MKMLAAAVPTLGPVPPRKLFYRIQEVSKLTGLKPYVLRYWETEFNELCPAKDASDQRRYRLGDIEVILAIRKLLYEDRFTIEGARKRLKEELRQLRGEPAAAGPAGSKTKTTKRAATASEKLTLEEFLPAPVREAARRAQSQARRPSATRHRVLRDVAPGIAPGMGADLEIEAAARLEPADAPGLFDAEALRPSASIISIAPGANAAAARMAEAHMAGEMLDHDLETAIRSLRSEVDELLAILS